MAYGACGDEGEGAPSGAFLPPRGTGEVARRAEGVMAPGPRRDEASAEDHELRT